MPVETRMNAIQMMQRIVRNRDMIIREKKAEIEEMQERIRDLRQLAANQNAEITELKRRTVNISEVLDDVLESQDVCRQALEKLRDAINGLDK